MVIFFDATLTLIRPIGGMGELFLAPARQFGPQPDSGKLGAFFKSAVSTAKADGGSFGPTVESARIHWEKIGRSLFRLAGSPAPPDDYYEALFQRVADPKAWEVFPDVLDTLDDLHRRGTCLGVLSNFDVRLPQLVQALGIGAYFEFILTSADAEAEKPDPRIFLYAEHIAGTKRIGYIGDSYLEDYVAPRSSGWISCLLDRERNCSDESVTAAHTLFGAAGVIIEKLGGNGT